MRKMSINLASIAGFSDSEAFHLDTVPQKFAYVGLIVDNEDAWVLGAHHLPISKLPISSSGS